MNRYFKSFILTIFLYTSIIAAVIYSTNEKIETKSAKKSLNRVKVTILAPKQPQRKIIQKPKKIVKKKPKIKPKPKKVIKKKPKLKPKPKKRVIKKKIKPKSKKKIIKKEQKPKKIIKKKPESKKIKEYKKLDEKKEKKVIKPKKEQKFIPKKQIKQTISKSKVGINKKDEKLKQLKKQKYFELIKQTIYKNKVYPRSARRRGIQGVVEVEFIISNKGELLKIYNLKGKKIFYKSIRNAIKKSFPITPPKGIFNNNIKFNIKIVYKLR